MKKRPGLLVRGGESTLVAILTAVQVAHILDFVIMMPLGPQLMRIFGITPAQFGILVSAYTFSAAASGLLSAFLIDRFDRKRALVSLFAGFGLGTLGCALAPNYLTLLLARIFAGAFGGVLSGLVFAIVADSFPDSRRGAALGRVMSAFSISSVAGVPLGLFLANRLGWHAPFFLLAGAAAAVGVAAELTLPPMRGHLAHAEQHARSSWRRMREVLTHSNHVRAFTMTFVLMMGAFSVIPFISPYLVANVGLKETDLPFIYLVGGSCTFFSSRKIGQIADFWGKKRTFVSFALLSILPILTLTNLPPVPVPMAIAVTTVFTILISGRFVPLVALLTTAVTPRNRGTFLSLNSSVQSLGSSCASFAAGLIISRSGEGRLLGYERIGWMATLATLACILLVQRVESVES